MESGNDIVSRAVSSQVPSARGGLTSVFGMGTGGSLQPLSPEIMYGGSLPASASSRPSLRLVSPSLLRSPHPPSGFCFLRFAPVPLRFFLLAFLSVRAQLFASDSPFASALSFPSFRTLKTAQGPAILTRYLFLCLPFPFASASAHPPLSSTFVRTRFLQASASASPLHRSSFTSHRLLSFASQIKPSTD